MAKQEKEPISRKEAAEVVGGTGHMCGQTVCLFASCACICETHCSCDTDSHKHVSS